MNNQKECFGRYENNDNSWHCIGCIIAKECKSYREVKHMKDNSKVNHPEHYNKYLFECIDEMVILFGVEAVIAFCKCNAWKYRERAPYKGNPEQDNEKADWYLNKAKELEEQL